MRLLFAGGSSVEAKDLLAALSKYYEVIPTSDIGKALEILHDNDIDLVIASYHSSNIPGLKLLSTMKNDLSLASIPFLMITMAGNLSEDAEAFDLGAIDVIRVPFVSEIVISRVKNLLSLQETTRAEEQNRLSKIELKRQEEALQKAEHDELTGIYTRQGFFRHVRDYLGSHKDGKFEIVRFDIDHFSSINERFGSKTGDKILMSIAEGMAKSATWVGDPPIIAHFEADHFVGLHEPSLLTPEGILLAAEKWIADNLSTYSIKGRVGIYPISDPSIEPSLMCDRALLALRYTKGDFKNRVGVYDEELKKQLLDEQELSDEMIPALKKGLFVVYYQPQVEYPSNKIVGAEALVRWDHETRGMLQPGEFLPLFEKNNLITELDNYVWEKTVAQLSIWAKKYGEDNVPPVSVNISRVDAFGEDLVEKFKALVKKYQIPPKLLRLEITESAYMDDAEALVDIVSRLSKEGFLVEMDDFGSGYSSLNALKDIPVDILKLDMKFLSSSSDPSRSGNILSSTIRMARWLSLPVIAEGVETKEQADYLSSIGCHLIQGYYFSRPIPLEEYEKFYREHKKSEPEDKTKESFAMAEQFWNASNQTALIFNSYIGGAVIVERSGKSLEMLRANNEFYHLMKVSPTDYEPMMADVWSRFDKHNAEVYGAMLDEASEGKENCYCEIVSLPISGGEPIYTSNKAKLLARTGDSEIFYVSVENISAEKKAKEELIEQKELFSRLYNEVPCGIIDYHIAKDRTFSVVSFNDMAYELSGYKSKEEYLPYLEESQGLTNINVENQNWMKEKTHEAMKSGLPVRTEIEIARADKSTFWAEVRLQARAEKDGSYNLQASFIDITDRKNKETERYGKILFSLFDEIFLFDYEDNSAKAVKVGRVDGDSSLLDRVIPRFFLELPLWMKKFVDPKFLEPLFKFISIENLRNSCANGKIPKIEYDCLVKGKVVHLASSAFEIDSNHFLYCTKDVTKEVDKEKQDQEITILQATLEEEERYRIIVEQTNTAVIEWNYANNQFFHSDSYNRYVLSNSSPEKVMNNQGDLSSVYPDDLPALKQFFSESKSGADASEAIIRLKMKDGTFRYTRIRGSFLYSSEGDLLRAIGTFTDVNEEMVAKENLRKSNEWLERIITNIPSGVGIYRFDLDGKIVPLYISERTCEMFGFTREEYDERIKHGSPINFMPKGVTLSKEQLLKIKDGSSFSVPEIKAQKKDGTSFF